MRRIRGVATGRQAITLSLPQGEVTFDLSSTRRLRGVADVSTATVGRTGNRNVTLGAITVSMAGTVEDPTPAEPPLPTFVYSESVTATDDVDDVSGNVKLTVTSPAHLAAYDPDGSGAGIFSFGPDVAAVQPVVLYPGELEIDDPAVGGVISVTHPPFAVGIVSVTIAYRVMLGTTVIATSLPYDTTSRTAGERIEIFADVTDNGVTAPEIKVGEFTLAESVPGPVLSGFAVGYSGNSISLNSDLAATVRVRRYQKGHVFTNKATEVWAGTGASGSESNEFSAVSGANVFAPVWTAGISGPQEVWIAARVGVGPISVPVGGLVNITPDGSSFASPKFRGTSIGGSATAVSTVAAPLPAYQSGDLVQLHIGINAAASSLAGVQAFGPNGEAATVKQAPTDNGNGLSAALLYYRATAANIDGNVVVAIAAGGTVTAAPIICTSIVRYDVKASGDPYAQVVKTSSASAVATAATAALTAVSQASRVEAFILNDDTTPSGVAPTGWFMRQFALLGPQGVQTMSKDVTVTAANESIPAVSVSLGATAQPYVALTYELLPLGA